MSSRKPLEQRSHPDRFATSCVRRQFLNGSSGPAQSSGPSCESKMSGTVARTNNVSAKRLPKSASGNAMSLQLAAIKIALTRSRNSNSGTFNNSATYNGAIWNNGSSKSAMVNHEIRNSGNYSSATNNKQMRTNARSR